MGDGFLPETKDETEPVTCVMCGGSWWSRIRYVTPRKAWYWRLVRMARRECLMSDCSLCGYVAKWQPGTVNLSGTRTRFGR